MSLNTNNQKKLSKYISRGRVAEALDLVSRDTQGHYDECFVERLLGLSRGYLRENTDADERLLKLYELIRTNEIDQVNITRLLKYHRASAEAHSPSPASHRRLTTTLLDVLPTILLRNKPSELAAAVTLLLKLSYDDAAFKDMETKRFISFELPSGNDCRYRVKSILDVARYYILMSKNYHIEEDAQHLFVFITMQLSLYPSTLIDELKAQIEEMLLVIRTPIVYCLMCNLFETAPENCIGTELFYHIKCLLRRAFHQAIEEQSQSSLLGVAKCLAKANISASETIDKLKKVNNLDAIIMYVTNINSFNNNTLFSYIVYPILARCGSEDAQVIAGKLFMTREEKYFIERNLKDTIVQQCITYLRLATVREFPFHHYANTNIVSVVRMNYLLDVILEYLKCNYENPLVYKNLLDCCYTIREGQRVLKKSIWLFYLIDVLFQLIGKTNLEATPLIKPVFLELLQLLAKSHHRTTVFRSPSKLLRINRNWYHTVSLSYRYTDPEVLYELASFFDLSTSDLMNDEHQQERYVRLIWDHMLPIARQSEHRDLLGVLAVILIKIDLDSPKKSLEAVGIKRHRDIPTFVSEILITYSTVYSVVEKIIRGLVSVDAKEPAQSQDSDGRQWSKTKVGYLEWLDSEILPRPVRSSLDQLIKGVCTVIRGECDEDVKSRALIEINSFVKALLINDDSSERLLKRLVKTGILETLYVASTCSLYSERLQLTACEELPRIRKHVLDKLGTREQAAAKLLEALAEDNGFSPMEAEERAKKMASFLLSRTDYKKMRRDSEGDATNLDRLGLQSFLNDILDYPRIDWGPSECY